MSEVLLMNNIEMKNAQILWCLFNAERVLGFHLCLIIHFSLKYYWMVPCSYSTEPSLQQLSFKRRKQSKTSLCLFIIVQVSLAIRISVQMQTTFSSLMGKMCLKEVETTGPCLHEEKAAQKKACFQYHAGTVQKVIFFITCAFLEVNSAFIFQGVEKT